MKKTSARLWSAAAVATLAGSLLAAPVQAAPVQAAPTMAASAGAAPQDAKVQELAARLAALTPASAPQRLAAANARLGVDVYQLSPGDYECSTGGPLESWAVDQARQINPATLSALAGLGGPSLPLYYSLLIDQDDTDESFGPAGQYTRIQQRRLTDLKRFWDIDSSGTMLQAVKGDVLVDEAKMAPVFRVLFGVDDALAGQLASLLHQLIALDPGARGGDNPYFSINSAFVPAMAVPGVGQVPGKILIGDGILEGFAAVGLGDVAPTAMLAHEFGHHVQWETKAVNSPLTGPEATRRLELMADAQAGYYLAHARGASYQAKRVGLFETAFFQLGDCAFASDGHHGTPNQRERSAAWGHGLAQSAPNQGHILPSRTLITRFDAALPALVAPDAP